MPEYRLTINVGGLLSSLTNDSYSMSLFSNFGDCVDIFAPGEVKYPYVNGESSSDSSIAVGTSCAAPLVAGVAASIMSEHPDIQYDNELMRKTLIEMSIKNAIYDFKYSASSDTPNRFLNNGKKSIYSPDNENIRCGILKDNLNVTCSEGCCSKNGKCVSYKNDRNNECFIENGCQSEFGSCITMDQSIEKCDNELRKYEQCQINISSDMKEEDLTKYCKILNSIECEEFYRLQLTEQSSCFTSKKFINTTY
eukprot:jgi/Orpsp1_1/1179343/evm.model.c7180000068948.1